MFDYIQKVDSNISNFIQDNMHSWILDKLMIFFSSIGDGGVIWILVVLGFIITKKYRREGVMLLAVLLVTWIVGEGILKHLIQRPRPFESNAVINLLIDKPDSYSFPSGHTAIAFACATVLAFNFKKYTIYFYIIAALIAFSRVYLYVHYTSDILGGMLLGLICSKIIICIFTSRNIMKFDKS